MENRILKQTFLVPQLQHSLGNCFLPPVSAKDMASGATSAFEVMSAWQRTSSSVHSGKLSSSLRQHGPT